MKDPALLKEIEKLAGPLRAKTFVAAAEWILEHECKFIVETGCYRGIPADGQSTIILAKLAMKLGAAFESHEYNGNHITEAKQRLAFYGIHPPYQNILFVQGDSVETLGFNEKIDFAYLDSFDYQENAPLQSQRHQLAEIGALHAALRRPCAILMDDCFPPHGGKTGLSKEFLLDRGWTLAAAGYQLLFTKDT